METNKPKVGDSIALDHGDTWHTDFNQNISWYCAEILEVDGDNYRVSYNDKWHTFPKFGEPIWGGRGISVYPVTP